MTMSNFLKKLIEGSGILPTEACLDSFNDNFPEAINVEWTNKKEHFEAIFYRNNIEYIALFNDTGLLLEYRQNLPIEFLPESIKNIALLKGEIMNSVLKNKGNKLEYEIIVRDSALKRILVVYSDMGEVLDEKIL